MSAVLDIDLQRNPDVAALVADMEPGDNVYACFSIKSKDDQTLTVRLKEMAATRDELPDATEYDESDDEDSESTPDDESAEGESTNEKPEPSPEKSRGSRMIEAMGRGTDAMGM